MNCFYHNDLVAIGTCKSCSKGVCATCAVDVGDGIACKSQCEEKVQAINKLISQSDELTSKSSEIIRTASPVGGILFNLATGLIFVVYGLKTEGLSFLALLGLLFLSNGLFSVYRLWSRRSPANDENEA